MIGQAAAPNFFFVRPECVRCSASSLLLEKDNIGIRDSRDDPAYIVTGIFAESA